MSQIKLIRDYVDNDRKVFGFLKKEEYPLYLWGSGNVADEVYQVLAKYGIKLAGVFVDVTLDNEQYFMGYKIESLSEIENRYKKINIILGHAQYHKKREMELHHFVNKVFYILNPFKTHDNLTYEYYSNNFL